MMFGLRDSFEYLECIRCGCLQLLDVPRDWSRYYPPDYYSFSIPSESRVKRIVKRIRARHALGHRSVLGGLLIGKWGVPPFVPWVLRAGIGLHASILDVGSGSGHLLREMGNAGFSNLTGVDPYIPADMTLGPGVRILRRHLRDVEGNFDFVMMNLSFEHIEDPESTLSEVARLLPPGRLLLLRIPVVGKWAWRQYGTNWVQLDAPRHIFLHSEESIRLLAERCSFAVRAVSYDSTAFQFWGSEQYERDIPLNDPRSYAVNPANSPFTRREIAVFDRRASELNRQCDGDLACFYLARE